MAEKNKLSYRSFRKVFFVFSVVFLLFAWVVSSHPFFLTICVCASIFFASCGFHAWWKMRKQAKKKPTITPKQEVLLLPMSKDS